MEFYEKDRNSQNNYRLIDPSEELPTKNVCVLCNGAMRPATQAELKQRVPIKNNLQHTQPIPFVAPSAETPLEVPQMNFSGQADASTKQEDENQNGLALPKMF